MCPRFMPRTVTAFIPGMRDVKPGGPALPAASRRRHADCRACGHAPDPGPRPCRRRRWPPRGGAGPAGSGALGLAPDAPIGLVMFGGQGSVQMLRIAQTLPTLPLVFVCGHNAGVLSDLRALKRPAPHVAMGCTQDLVPLMRAADFFIGKPGPGSVAAVRRASARRLPGTGSGTARRAGSPAAPRPGSRACPGGCRRFTRFARPGGDADRGGRRRRPCGADAAGLA